MYHNSQVHFAPTHIAELSAYDPERRIEQRIYPPAKADPVRANFVARVRAAYTLRGEAWFRQNNHHMNAELFDSWITPIVADESTHTIAFLAHYENPINDAHDPLTEREEAVTTCASIDRVGQISCKERPLVAWADQLKLSKATILKERADPSPVTQELLRRAAASPGLVP